MKLKLQLATALVLAASFQATKAALQASLPEFKSKQQIQAGRSKAGEIPSSAGVFYTGKPFDESGESFLFQYRSYSPELNRWASMDPSGFPDGANNQAYAPVPTTELDYQGLLALSGNVNPNPESPADISYNGHTFRLITWTATHIASTNFSFSGWSLHNGGTHAGTLNLTTYAARDSGSTVGTEIEISTSGLGTPTGSYDWIQRVNTNLPLAGQPNPKFDNYPPGSSTPNNDPFYAGGKATGNNPTFYDYSQRSYATAFDALINKTVSKVTWAGTLYLVNAHYDTKVATIYDGLQWGWSVKMIE
jgi:RHS repeat-associated protein